MELNTTLCCLCKGREKEKNRRRTHKRKQKIHTKLARHLPNDIISIILSKLPLKSLLQSRTVSKQWNLLTRTPHFITSHHQNHPPLFAFPSFRNHSGLTNVSLFEKDEITATIPFKTDLQGKTYGVLSSCNGFLLLASSILNRFVIYNPVTSETVTNIPTPPKDAQICPVLGFDDKRNEYKLVLLNYVITVGESSWRKITSPYDHLGSGTLGKPVFIHGNIYWPHLFEHHVVSFDFCNEKYTTIEFPCEARMLDNFNYHLVEYENKLGLTAFNRQYQQVKVWSLEAEEDNWIRQATCNINYLLSRHCCEHHKYILVDKVGNDSFLLFHVKEDTNLGYDQCVDYFGLQGVWWKRPIIYTPKSGGCMVRFTANPNEHLGEFTVFRFVPNLASFYGSN